MGDQADESSVLLLDKKRRARSEPRESKPAIAIAENTQVGRFGLIRELARGGMGQVFLARDTKLGRKVAIKFLLDDNPSFVQRFLIEARATALCTHENIVTIFEVGEHAGLPFMVLEYLKGQTLSALLANKMAPRPFAELMISVARALERAHEHGIVHRDLKPSNIFVTDRGTVKVLDFGVAKLFESPVEAIGRAPSIDDLQEADGIDPITYVTFSGNGWVVGTLPYMSPEQWGAAEIDHRSDLWAVGILFWRALTGVHPAGVSAPAALHARMTDLADPMPSIGAQDPSLPKELVAIVDRCLAMDVAKRYQTASELAADLHAFVQPGAARIDSETCPYRGLSAFGEVDAKYFFGRSGEIRSALAQLETWPLLAVIGPSGVGKSSFVHAGLVPAIRATGVRWRVCLLRPGRAPITSLANVLEEATGPGTVTDVITHLADSPGQFGELLRSHAVRDGSRLLIVVDQLEELFTLSDDARARETFLSALFAAADDPSSPVRVVLSMRADFLDRLAGDRQFLAELSRGLFFLSAPDRDHLRETLVRPAELAGYAFEKDSIVDEIIQTAANRGALPLLQFAATKLWDARDRKAKLLTRASYDAMGGVAGAFVRHADEVAAAVPPQQQVLLRAILTRLVTPEGTRAVIDRTELLSIGNDEAAITRILDQLVRARLVHVHNDPATGATVEIVHEALITEWPMLQRWLEDGSAVRVLLAELRHAARKWAANGRRADLVWRGAAAAEAIALTDRHVLDLAATEREYLAAVQGQAARSRRIKLGAVTAVIAVLVTVIAVGTIGVVRISRAEQDAQQKALTAANEALRARQAEAESAARLAELEAAEQKRLRAEAMAAEKGEAFKLEEQKRVQAELDRKTAELAALQAAASEKNSREDSETNTAELELAVAALEKDRANVQRLLDQARKDFEDARQSNLRLQHQLAAEKQKREQLERDRDTLLE